jgi:UrcA family protein
MPGDGQNSEDDMKVHLAAAAALAMTSLPATGVAEEIRIGQDRIRSIVVSYDAATLGSEAGARDLLGRLETAAHGACGGDPRRHSSYAYTPDLTREVFRKCRDEAVARAVAEIGAPRLVALHADPRTAESRAR